MNVCKADVTELIPQAAVRECSPPALPMLSVSDSMQCLADLSAANPAASQLALTLAVAAALAVRSAAYKALADIVVSTSYEHFCKDNPLMPDAVHRIPAAVPLIPAAFAQGLVTANFGFAFELARELASDVTNSVANDVAPVNEKILIMAANVWQQDRDDIDMEHVRLATAVSVPAAMYDALCDIIIESSIPEAFKINYSHFLPNGKPTAGTNNQAFAVALANAEFQTAFDLASNVAWDIGNCVACDIATPRDWTLAPVDLAADDLEACAKAAVVATEGVRNALADETAALAAAVDATAASVNLVIPAANAIEEHVEDAVADVEIVMPAVEQMHVGAEEHVTSLTLAAASAVATVVLEALVLAEAAAFAAAKDKLLSPAADAGEGHVAGHETLAVATAAAFAVAVRDAALKSFALADALTKSLAVEDTVAEIEFLIPAADAIEDEHVEGEPADVLPRQAAPWHKGEFTDVMAKYMKLAGSSQNSWLISEERRHVTSRMPLSELRRRRLVGPYPPFKPRRRISDRHAAK